jgi:hypothetical protein
VPVGNGFNTLTPDDGPTAVDDEYTVVHDTMLEVTGDGVLANDGDEGEGTGDPEEEPEDSPLFTVLQDEPEHGTLVTRVASDILAGGGAFTYVPDAGFVGTDTFTYTATDGFVLGETATVTIEVTNEEPGTTPDEFTGQEGYRISGDVLWNDCDPDGDPLGAVLTTGPQHGVIDFRDDGTFLYTPEGEGEYFGPDSFAYTVSDGIVTSAAVTVALDIREGPPADLDVWDPTEGRWMPEWQEKEGGWEHFGKLGLSVAQPNRILARAPGTPPENGAWTTRMIDYDKTCFSLGGNETFPDRGVLVLPSSEDVSVNVVARRDLLVDYWGHPATIGYGINYDWVHLGQPALEGYGDCVVAGLRGDLVSLEITTDHKELLKGFNPLDKPANPIRFRDIEYIRNTDNGPAPVTQTMDTAVEVKVVIDLTGVDVNTPYKLVGTGPTAALSFESGALAAAGGRQTVTMTAKEKLPKAITTVKGDVGWKVVLNPGQPNEKTLPITGATFLKVYVLWDKPRNTNVESSKPTEGRVRLAVEKAGQAYNTAKTNAMDDPTPAQIVYELLQLHKFNGKHAIVAGGNVDALIAKGWTVPENWTTPKLVNGKSYLGSDCISGATFTRLAALAVGLPGAIEAKNYMAKSATEPTEAVVFDINNQAYFRPDPEYPQIPLLRNQLMLILGGKPNNYEGTVVFTEGGTTLYFPAGTDYVFDNADAVLTIFQRLAWVRVGKPPKIYGQSPGEQYVHTYIDAEEYDLYG